jgi:hypothetical protein
MQPNLDFIQLLMQELAPATPEITAIDASEGMRWSVRFEDGIRVQADAAAEPARLMLSAPLGRPGSAMQLAACETLLSYNLLWRETGGVKAGLIGPDGDAVLLFELYADPLPLAELRTVMVNFANLARVWGAYIKSEISVEPEMPMSGSALDMRA